MNRVAIRRAGDPENWRKEQAEHHIQQSQPKRKKNCGNCLYSEDFKAANYSGDNNFTQSYSLDIVSSRSALKRELHNSSQWAEKIRSV